MKEFSWKNKEKIKKIVKAQDEHDQQNKRRHAADDAAQSISNRSSCGLTKKMFLKISAISFSL